MNAASHSSVWLQALYHGLQRSHERRLVWVRGTHLFTRDWVRKATRGLDDVAQIWVGNEAGEASPSQARQYLGREFDVLVWDARAGMHPDGFGALAGTLRGGGLLILLTPAQGEWRTFDDPDYARLSSAPTDKAFLARLERVLTADPSVLPVASGQPLPPLPGFPDGPALTLPTPDQEDVLEAIRKVRHGHRRRPLVITADRGRGKSSALGMAAAELVAHHEIEIAVTAPRAGALRAFWQHAEAGLGDASPGSDGLKCGAGRIRYYPPHQLLQELPRADLLLVDEAAAIPVPTLVALLDHYARIVFASTIHGYEGSGRGFALRFRDFLTAKTPHWRALTLTQPVRWALTDPLEPLINRLLLLDAEQADLPALGEGRPPGLSQDSKKDGALELVAWPRSARAGDETRLTEVFGLLANAHYQTTPDDLRLLLDDVSSHCWLALEAGAVVGVVWVLAEGPLDKSTALAVRRGERRTRGQLLPQALAAYGGDHTAATLGYWRLVRIAVHPERRRSGLGRRLVALALEEARSAGVDVFGTSFGVSPELMEFWERCGLLALRLGLGRDAASGAPSLMLGLGLSALGESICKRQSRRFAEHWPTLLATELRDLEPGLVWPLSAAWVPSVDWSAQDALEIDDFSSGFRPLALTRMPLQRLTWRHLSQLPGLLGSEADLWCRAVIQQVPEADWQRLGLASGRKQAYGRLRQTAGRLLESIEGRLSSSE